MHASGFCSFALVTYLFKIVQSLPSILALKSWRETWFTNEETKTREGCQPGRTDIATERCGMNKE